MSMSTPDTATAEIRHQLQAVNAEALVYFARACMPGMVPAGWGRTVAIGSAVMLHQQTRDFAYLAWLV
ncbi:hypothetical protein QZM89_34065 [Burkholderia gladioli]|uniref:hypothetical protein n=1 Tax=Burkholderia gladioli TaxID=28095 RepID=UPI002652CB43|nr:hypothetical protein [Burkholderia gladioli]MDN7500223.1 hypothetical protein [Burkholderia gladioli]